MKQLVVDFMGTNQIAYSIEYAATFGTFSCNYCGTELPVVNGEPATCPSHANRYPAVNFKGFMVDEYDESFNRLLNMKIDEELING